MHVTDTPLSRTQRLKAATHATHDALDQRIMAYRPFSSHAHYRRFLQAQYLFLRDADALYDNPGLAALFADLAERRRQHLIAADLDDLGCPLGFYERVGIGFDLPSGYTASLGYEHTSNWNLCARNAGLTNIGFRLGKKL